jgi:hypothetical protein
MLVAEIVEFLRVLAKDSTPDRVASPVRIW